jgi:type VI secretion system protein ImpH
VGPKSRRANPALGELLFQRGYEFEFFQAVRLLSLLERNRKPVGRDAKPSEEVVRMGTQVTLAFPPSPVHDIVHHEDSPHEMTVACFGLTGTQGVLPHFYTEHLLARRGVQDNAMVAFFDLFNHRLLSFFYRAWEKHQPIAGFEQASAAAAGEPDQFTHHLFDLVGMGTEGLRGKLGIPDEALLFYGGLVAQRPRSASAVRGILRDYFQVPVEIEQFVGDWYNLREDDRSYMWSEGVHNEMDGGAIAGDQVWDQQARFRIRVGPLDFRRFQAFLPEGSAVADLIAWIRFLVGPYMTFEVNVVLKASEVPYCRLTDSDEDSPRLGWVGWLKTEEFRQDATDVEFTYVN